MSKIYKVIENWEVQLWWLDPNIALQAKIFQLLTFQGRDRKKSFLLTFLGSYSQFPHEIALNI